MSREQRRFLVCWRVPGSSGGSSGVCGFQGAAAVSREQRGILVCRQVPGSSGGSSGLRVPGSGGGVQGAESMSIEQQRFMFQRYPGSITFAQVVNGRS